jgi:hypothetical protein
MGLDWAERNNLPAVLLLAKTKEMSNALLGRYRLF